MRERKLAVFLAGAMALTACAAFADRPLTIDDADPVDFKTCKVEVGGWYENDCQCKLGQFPFGVDCGIIPTLEFDVDFGGQFEERNEIVEKSEEYNSYVGGIGDLVVSAKWQFLGEKTWLPRQALVPAIKFPTADRNKDLGSGKTDYDLTWIASKSFCEKMGGHINVGYSWIGETADNDLGDILHYGLALDYHIVNPLQWVGEVYAQDELRRGINTIVMFNTGFRYSILECLIADIAAGSRIAGDGPYFTATAGLTWNFGWAQSGSK